MERNERGAVRVAVFAVAWLLFSAGTARGQLFDNLRAFGERLATGSEAVPSMWEGGTEGPKGIATGDLDGNGQADLAVSNLDGTVTVYLNAGAGRFGRPIHLYDGAQTLRDIVIGDLTGDGKPDIAAAAILDAAVVIFPGQGGGTFGEPVRIGTWLYARNLATGDFDGDGALDLAVAGSAQGLRTYRRAPDGTFEPLSHIPELGTGFDWSKPVYSLKAVRSLGADRDDLVVTHAWLQEVCVFTSGAGGKLAVRGCVPQVRNAISLDAAPITGPAAEGRIDLVTCHIDVGVIQVRKGAAGPARFEETVHQEIAVPGGPRFASIIDIDGDGWNDLAVVLRYFDRVLTYRNNRGKLEPSYEMPVGTSPREIAGADFNADGQSDLAVINRLSGDVSVLIGYPGKVGFEVLDQFYLVDGEVSALVVADANGDGRDDVFQLHRASSDFSLRLAAPDGSLATPAFFTIGVSPVDLSLMDLNRDGHLDAIASSFGSTMTNGGFVSIRLGDGMGGFGPEKRIEPPATLPGGLFGQESADFDGDGILDLATGHFDCRLTMFRGLPDGSLVAVSTSSFAYESRAMESGDFDGDGDVDLAGASATGTIIVLENRGNFLADPNAFRTEYPSPTPGKFGTNSLLATDLNGDGDLDLVVGSPKGVMHYEGAEGMKFVLMTAALAGTESFQSVSVTSADFDGDGTKEIAAACQILSCITILKKGPGGYSPALTVDIPAGRFIASGDLDGDGHADLVGTGSALWTSLSSRRAERAGPPVFEDRRERIEGLVINEILASNSLFAVAKAQGRRTDWVEIYNGSTGPIPLGGFKLALEAPGVPRREYQLPAEIILAKGGHFLLVSDVAGGGLPFHTGFRLPGEGGRLLLLSPSGAEVDLIEYPEQMENISYSRYRDGLPSFVFSVYPTPEASNADNGSVEPRVDLIRAVEGGNSFEEPFQPPRPGRAIRFYARGRDDVGIVTLSLLYRRLDIFEPEPHRVILFDDGLNRDGETQDGLFSGALAPALPAGGQIQFYLEGVDFIGTTVTIPENASLRPDIGGGKLYSLAVGVPMPRIEISEFVARNASGLVDELGQTSDWVEVRNCSGSPLPLDGIYLGDRFPASDDWFSFSAGKTLAPGEHLVVFCDGNPGQGPSHAPFRLDGGGGRLFLVGTTPLRAHGIIDAIEYGAQAPDVALGRSSCGGPWTNLEPTPGAVNGKPIVTAERGDANRSGLLDITDAITILMHLFGGGEAACPEAADTNGDNRRDVADAIYLLNYLFLGGPAPAGGQLVICR